MLQEHDVVTIVQDIPEQGVERGDVGAIVHCYAGGKAFEVELLDQHGRSKGTITVEEPQLLRLNLKSLVA